MGKKKNKILNIIFILGGVSFNILCVHGSKRISFITVFLSFLVLGISLYLLGSKKFFSFYEFRNCTGKSTSLHVSSVIITLLTLRYLYIYFVEGSSWINYYFNLFFKNNILRIFMLRALIVFFAGIFLFLIIETFILYSKDIVYLFFTNLCKKEKIYLFYSTIIMSILIIIIYSQTSIFSFPTHVTEGFKDFNVIYTFDTGNIVSSNCYMNFFASQNDLRQPLFALFSFPFGLVSAILKDIFFFLNGNFVSCTAMAIIQNFLMNISIILLARMIDKVNYSFMFLFSLTYTYALFSLNLEQYVIGFFWLMLFLYNLYQKNRASCFLYIAATGCLITNGILILALLIKNKEKNVLSSIKILSNYSLAFLASITVCGQLPICLDQILDFGVFRRYMDFIPTYFDKINNYFSFLTNVLLVPKSFFNIDNTLDMAPVSQFRIVFGFVIFLIILIIFYKRKKDEFVRFMFGWIIFSIVIIVIVGLGVVENAGTILYSLYFGWPVIAMIYIFLDDLLRKRIKLRNKIYGVLAFFLFAINMNMIIKIVLYGQKFYSDYNL